MSSPRSSEPARSRRCSGAPHRRRGRRRRAVTRSSRSTSSTRRVAAFEALGRPDALIHLAWGGLPNYGSAHHFERELPAHAALADAAGRGRPAEPRRRRHLLRVRHAVGRAAEIAEAAPANAYAVAKDALRRRLQALQRAAPVRADLGTALLPARRGPGPEGALLPQLQRAVEAGAATFPMSGGEQLRDYLPVEEAADDLVRLALARRGPRHRQRLLRRSRSPVRALVERWLAAHGRTIELDLGRFPIPPTSRWPSGATT